MSEYLIPISTASQSFISNDMEIRVPINKDDSIDHHSITTTKSNTFVRERGIVSNVTFPSDKNTLIIRMMRKMGVVGKKNIVPFISSSVHIL